VGVRVPRARLIVSELPAAGGLARVVGEESSHARALRLAPGDPVALLDGSGREARGTVRRLGARMLEVEVEEVRPAVREDAPIALWVAGIRAERLSWLAEKATELGADRIAIVSTERTQGFRAAPGLVPRLTRVVREAAKQAERTRWPEISGPLTLSRALLEEPSPTRIFLDLEGAAFPGSLPRSPAALLIGPEGGWTRAESEAARAAGWQPVALPAGKLRTETAAIAALILLRAAREAGNSSFVPVEQR